MKVVTTERRGKKWAWKVRTPVGDAASSAEYDTKEEAHRAGVAEADALCAAVAAATYEIGG